LSASPAPWCARPAARSAIATPTGAGLRRTAEADLAVAAQDGHLMPKRNNLKFQSGTATNTEGEQGNQGRKNRDHAHDGMAATQKSLGFLRDSEF
jgi:hypothetical protein